MAGEEEYEEEETDNGVVSAWEPEQSKPNGR
jgi:hypothetical protein